MFSDQKRKWLKTQYTKAVHELLSRDEQAFVENLADLVIDAIELVVSSEGFLDRDAQVPDIDHDGHLLESDANYPNMDPPAKSAVDTSTLAGPEASPRPKAPPDETETRDPRNVSGCDHFPRLRGVPRS